MWLSEMLCKKPVLPKSLISVRNFTTNETTGLSKWNYFKRDEKPVCDKSRLLQQHYNIVHGKSPYSQPSSWIHQLEKYQRKKIGTYGTNIDTNVRICFSSKKDFLVQNVNKDFVESYSFHEALLKINAENKFQKELTIKREEEINRKMEKSEIWKKELTIKIASKERESIEAKHRKERLIEEVRRHFGFKVDVRDEKFKELLEQKEKELKKKEKEAKRKVKQDKMLSKLMQQTSVV